MQILKSVGVMSVAKIMGLLYGCIGLIFTPLFLLLGLLGSSAGHGKTALPEFFGVGFAILMPIFYGVIGAVTGAIGAQLYNVLANWIGGIEVELRPRAELPVAGYPTSPRPTPVV
jgi:hypothetical protein